MKRELTPMMNEKMVAEFMGVDVSWLRRKRVEGGGPNYFKFGKYVRYQMADLERWMGQNQRSGTSSALARCVPARN